MSQQDTPLLAKYSDLIEARKAFLLCVGKHKKEEENYDSDRNENEYYESLNTKKADVFYAGVQLMNEDSGHLY